MEDKISNIYQWLESIKDDESHHIGEYFQAKYGQPYAKTKSPGPTAVFKKWWGNQNSNTFEEIITRQKFNIVSRSRSGFVIKRQPVVHLNNEILSPAVEQPNENIDPEFKKDIDTAVEIIIRNCRMRYQSQLGKALAYEQLEGLIRCLTTCCHIDRGFDAATNPRFASLDLQDEYQKKIEEVFK